VSSEGSITILLGGLKSGDSAAARKIWERYSARLSALAQTRLPIWLRRVVDGEDVANHAFHCMVTGVLQGRYPDMKGREDFWAHLAVITVRKAMSEVKQAKRKKRPPGSAQVEIDDHPGEEKQRPDLEAMAAEQFDSLIDQLRSKDEELARIALWKFEGFTHEEIAEKLGCSVRRVARKLVLVRLAWEMEER
jgi:RNA polymerase sigma factor (sigma-70 family)